MRWAWGGLGPRHAGHPLWLPPHLPAPPPRAVTQALPLAFTATGPVPPGVSHGNRARDRALSRSPVGTVCHTASTLPRGQAGLAGNLSQDPSGRDTVDIRGPCTRTAKGLPQTSPEPRDLPRSAPQSTGVSKSVTWGTLLHPETQPATVCPWPPTGFMGTSLPLPLPHTDKQGTHAHTHTYVHAHACTHPHTCTCMHTYTHHPHAHPPTPTRMHAHKHTHTHYLHTCTRAPTRTRPAHTHTPHTPPASTRTPVHTHARTHTRTSTRPGEPRGKVGPGGRQGPEPRPPLVSRAGTCRGSQSGSLWSWHLSARACHRPAPPHGPVSAASPNAHRSGFLTSGAPHGRGREDTGPAAPPLAGRNRSVTRAGTRQAAGLRGPHVTARGQGTNPALSAEAPETGRGRGSHLHGYAGRLVASGEGGWQGARPRLLGPRLCLTWRPVHWDPAGRQERVGVVLCTQSCL